MPGLALYEMHLLLGRGHRQQVCMLSRSMCKGIVRKAFPDGELEGAVLHWALAGRASAPWQRPPAGYATDPAATSDAGAHAVRVSSARILLRRTLLAYSGMTSAGGGAALETPLERVPVPGCEARPDIAAWAATLQVPPALALLVSVEGSEWVAALFLGRSLSL